MSSKTLFRFLTEEAAVKTLEAWSFRVGRILELNDPFEWRFGIENIRPGSEEIVELITQRACKALHDILGVICFSETASDSVLWSHYADRHRGIVIEVDYELKVPPSIFPVRYTDRRPTLDANLVRDTNYVQTVVSEKIKELVVTKSPGWAYEKEWRVIVDLKECTARNGSYFTPIPTSFVKRIILGPESTLGVQYVEHILRQRGISDVIVIKAHRALTTFEILV